MLVKYHNIVVLFREMASTFLELETSRACEWCSAPIDMKQELPGYANKPLYEWDHGLLEDLRHCYDCVEVYHRLEDELIRERPEFKKVHVNLQVKSMRDLWSVMERTSYCLTIMEHYKYSLVQIIKPCSAISIIYSVLLTICSQNDATHRYIMYMYIIFPPMQILATVPYFHTLSLNIIFWLVPCLVNRTTLHVRGKLLILVERCQITNYVYQIMKYVMCEIFFDPLAFMVQHC